MNRIRWIVSAALVGLMALAGPAAAKTWYVASVVAIENAVRDAGYGDEIVVTARTYYMQAELQMKTANVSLRGATGNRDEVVFIGGGMNTDAGPRNIIHVKNDDITISDLTVSQCYWNGIQLHGEDNVDRTTLRNVKTLNIGERHVKGSKGSITNAMHDVVIENCYFQQTQTRTPRPGDLEGDYIGGIDAMVAKDWIIRDNVFEGIAGYSGYGRGAIFLWQGVTSPTIERNVIIDCDRGIAMGNPYNPDKTTHLVTGGIIRNNTVLSGNYLGMELDYCKDLKILNNTIYDPNASNFRALQMYDQGGGSATSGLELVNNILRGNVWDQAAGDWSASTVRGMGNIVDSSGASVVPGWFEDVAGGDLHLTEQALAAINAASVLADVPEDMDRVLRPALPDLGADEYCLPGDANQDFSVDVMDLGLLGNHWTDTDCTWGDGDFNADGTVDVMDLSILANHYRTTFGGAGGTPVPEPTTLLIVTAAGLPMLLKRSRNA